MTPDQRRAAIRERAREIAEAVADDIEQQVFTADIIEHALADMVPESELTAANNGAAIETKESILLPLSEYNELMAELNGLQADKVELLQCSKESVIEYAYMRDALIALRKERDEAREQLSAAEDEIDLQAKSADHFKQQLAIKDESINYAKGKISTLQNQLEKVTAELEALKKSHD